MKQLLLTILIIASVINSQEYIFSDSLTTDQKVLLDSVSRSFSIEDGCDGTIENTRNSIACPEAASFYNLAAWFAMNEKPYDYIIDKLRRHNSTYYHAEHYTLAPSYMSTAGDTSSPIHIIAYVSSDCPHCKKVGIPLRELVEGPLRGQASFAIKPIHHKIGDYALLAAKEQEKDWELFEAYGNITERLTEDKVIEAAKTAGLDVKRLKDDVDKRNDQYQKIIEDNHKEAKKNGMKFTPALYFNGYRYRSNKHPLWLIEYINYLTRTGKLQD